MARCTSAESGGCMRVLNLSALALRRTQPGNPGALSPPARVHCWVLGPARVTVDGVDAPPELLWRKHLALLVYLARSPRRSRTREHLVGLLWSDRDERQARHSLSEALRVLRRILGDDQVPADGDRSASARLRSHSTATTSPSGTGRTTGRGLRRSWKGT